jgi:predicted ATPase/class 3 adenylate cyclase/GAF domain-containing protein
MAKLLLSDAKGVKTYLVENTKWGTAVIQKILDIPYPSGRQVRDFFWEFNLLGGLDINGIRKPIGQDQKEDKPTAFYTYFDGFTLKKLVENGKNDLNLAINTGIFLADTLSQLHEKKIIHRGISANNVLYNPKAQEFCLIDFSSATTIKQKMHLNGSPDIIGGELGYISPEQTGRMNRRVDHRSDFYSLGIVLYEMLTGVLPFTEHDARETVYGHIALIPESPHERNPAVPPLLSNIVMKLLEKDANERYQSATGLLQDLQRIQSGIIKGTIDAFDIGEYDKSITLTISQKLYGREKEIKELGVHLHDVTKGNFGVYMVSGYSGSGKSSLVYEAYKTISKSNGYFLSGKFDQLQRNIPYYAIRQALKEYISFLLTEDGEYIDKVRQQILNAVENEGALIIEIIPELEHVIGVQPKVAALSGVVSQNRFNYVFSKFLKAITGSGQPLILFIDDLQWADLASLNLLSNIIQDQQNKYLLLIGAFRENEVSETHPLSQMIATCKESDVSIGQIHIENLTIEDIANLLQDSLNLSEKIVKPLAKILINHTDGNAFYTTQLIQNLFAQDILFFDEKSKEWRWDDKIIGNMVIPDNVVELMVQRVKKLDSTTQRLLKTGSCIGNTFSSAHLEILLDIPFGEFETSLICAQEEGLILADKEEYRFLHDRIQQAVYSLIPATERNKLHYEIGRRLLLKDVEKEEKQFEIIDQLNFAETLVADGKERLNYAALNLKAGRTAKLSTAYDASLKYLNYGLAFSNKDWHNSYQLLLDLHTNAAESAYLLGKYDEVDRHIEEVLKNATDLLHKVQVLKIEIEALKSQNNLVAAVEKGLAALERLDVKLPYKPSKASVYKKLLFTRLQMIGKKAPKLIDLKTMDDPYMLAAMQILVSIGPAVYWASPNLIPLTIFKMLLISVKYGNTDESTFAYSTYGLLLCGVTGEIKLGNKYGQLALHLSQKVNPINKVKGIFNVYCFVHHWSHKLTDSFSPFQEAHLLGRAAGDLEFSALSAYLYCNHAFYAGIPLPELEHDFKIYTDEIRSIKQYTPLNYNLLHWQVAHNLMHESSNPVELKGPIYEEKKMLPVHEKANDKTALFKFHLLKMMLNYLFGNVIQAYEHALKAGSYIGAVTGMYVTVEYYFYYGLVLAAKLEDIDNQPLQKGNKKSLAGVVKKFKKWSFNSPGNNQHKYELLQAEYCKVLGKAEKAKTHYAAAIKSATTNDFLNGIALANELAGKFYQQHEEMLSNFFLANAYLAYQQWGANTKCQELKFTYKLDDFFEHYSSPLQQGLPTSRTNDAMEHLDISTITEAAETISAEIHFDQLKTTLLKLLAENAGAEKAILFLVKDGKPQLEESWPDKRNKTRLYPDTIIGLAVADGEIIVIDKALSNSSFMHEPHFAKNKVRSALCMPLFHQHELIAIIYMENNVVDGAFSQHRIEFLQLLSGQMAISIKNSHLYQNLTEAYDEQVKLKNAYSKFVPMDFLKFLGKESILDVALGDQIQETVTIMFIDIVDYTSLSENMTPKENFDFINGCIRILGPVLRSHGGFISQFLGDGIMAIFKDAPDTALQAAIEIQEALRKYNGDRETKNRKPVRIGIGIHTGKVMLGVIGEQMRMDQNVISDDVNVASRVQDLTRVYDTDIILTNKTYSMLENGKVKQTRYLGKTTIKGRKEQVEIYECLDGLGETELKQKKYSLESFNAGTAAFYNGTFNEAVNEFQAVLSENPDDKAAALFLSWAKEKVLAATAKDQLNLTSSAN